MEPYMECFRKIAIGIEIVVERERKLDMGVHSSKVSLQAQGSVGET